MGVGDIISEARYNQLQGRISSLVGIGSGDKGYNQIVACNPVSVGSTVQVTDMNNMHTDFQKVYVHVNNQTSGTINTVATSNEIEDGLFTAYETLIIELEMTDLYARHVKQNLNQLALLVYEMEQQVHGVEHLSLNQSTILSN